MVLSASRAGIGPRSLSLSAMENGLVVKAREGLSAVRVRLKLSKSSNSRSSTKRISKEPPTDSPSGMVTVVEERV